MATVAARTLGSRSTVEEYPYFYRLKEPVEYHGQPCKIVKRDWSYGVYGGGAQDGITVEFQDGHQIGPICRRAIRWRKGTYLALDYLKKRR